MVKVSRVPVSRDLFFLSFFLFYQMGPRLSSESLRLVGVLQMSCVKGPDLPACRGRSREREHQMEAKQ